MAKVNVTKGRLDQVDDIIRSMKQWLTSGSRNNVARHLCDHIDEVCS